MARKSSGKSGRYGIPTLIGFGVVAGMLWMFAAPRLFAKPVAAVPVAPTAGGAVPLAPASSPSSSAPYTPGVPDSLNSLELFQDKSVDTSAARGVDNMVRFAGATFAEQIPGLSYGFPLSGIV